MNARTSSVVRGLQQRRAMVQQFSKRTLNERSAERLRTAEIMRRFFVEAQ
jgi:hypothetical protein